MPWKSLVCGAVAITAACGFDASYTGGTFLCSDGVCPTGLTCVAGVCRGGDGGPGSDAHPDAPTDGPTAALTCADPGSLADGSASGATTATTTSQVSALCGGIIQNGRDAVYQVDAAAGSALHVAIAGDYAVDAYVIAPCTPAPGTPLCVGSALATPGTPIVVDAVTPGAQFVVVDSENAAMMGSYTLTVSIQ